jgi:hypothetical protein
MKINGITNLLLVFIICEARNLVTLAQISGDDSAVWFVICCYGPQLLLLFLGNALLQNTGKL